MKYEKTRLVKKIMSGAMKGKELLRSKTAVHAKIIGQVSTLTYAGKIISSTE
jgi:hypothetical protein